MKTMAIDKFLSWAFVHELAKGGGENGLQGVNSAWRSISGIGELGTVIDTGNNGGSMYVEMGEPHTDAVEAGRAVARLAKVDLTIPAIDFVSDWDDPNGLLPDAVTAAVDRYNLRRPDMRRHMIVQLVISRAVLGLAPDWQAEPPKQRLVTRSNHPAWFVMKQVRDSLGRVHHVERDGFDRRKRRPMPGAYRKYELAYDPCGDIMDRIDWALWCKALKTVHSDLQSVLFAHRLLPWNHSQNPWFDAKSPIDIPLQNQHVA